MTSSATALNARDPAINNVFFCPEESGFYAHCLRSLVFAGEHAPKSIVEFGSGDGRPVIESLRESRFTGLIQGFELDTMACEIANTNTRLHHLQDRYKIANRSFFSHTAREANCLIANPPYLPAPDRDIRLPLLYGGEDGSALTNSLLVLGYDRALLMISSYSNPAGTIRHAVAQGYVVSNFKIGPLAFGFYSSEPKVKHRIEALKKEGKAFYDGDMYLLAGVLFIKRGEVTRDLSGGLIKILTAL